MGTGQPRSSWKMATERDADDDGGLVVETQWSHSITTVLRGRFLTESLWCFYCHADYLFLSILPIHYGHPME